MNNSRKTIRYSEAFKRQVVAEIEDGTLDNVEHARNKYGIRGTTTVQRWVRRFGKSQLLAKVVRVESPNERDQMRHLQQRIRDLEHALAESRMRELLAEGYLHAICEDAGIKDLEERKKKWPGGPSASQPTRAGRKGGSR
ncbi:MAG TPA: hypothetical protein DDZ88_02935 [Verrucomicrobiales bacterium]|nr:hypothetical protein [Verrucomicrobiales bacterium]